MAAPVPPAERWDIRRFSVHGERHTRDVLGAQREFHLDASVGVPVADGSEEAQDWGLPAYRWEVIGPEGYRWLAERTRRCADLFDAFRVDHLVGFYRTYARDRRGHGFFSPGDEHTQVAQGEALMALFRSRGSLIVAEDLGVVPDFVRASQARLGVPGLKVLRWERLWHSHGQPFRTRAITRHARWQSAARRTERCTNWEGEGAKRSCGVGDPRRRDPRWPKIPLHASQARCVVGARSRPAQPGQMPLQVYRLAQRSNAARPATRNGLAPAIQSSRYDRPGGLERAFPGLSARRPVVGHFKRRPRGAEQRAEESGR